MSGGAYAAFRAALEAGRGSTVVRERVAALDTPVGAFRQLTGAAPAKALLQISQ